MHFIKPHIARIAKEFWLKTSPKGTFPFDICGAVSLALPLDIISLSELSLKKIVQWLGKRNLNLNIDADDRFLHGFIITFRGSGFIFVNGTDLEEERRYTVAHEASHFILDYKQPRDKTIKKLGKGIEDVLDGYRDPTVNERIDGALTAVNVQPYTHLFEKVGDGSFNSMVVFDSENNADSLALELLAPHYSVIRDTFNGNRTLPFSHFAEQCSKILIEKYRLPESIAKQYSLRLAYMATGGPSLLSKLGF